EGKCRVSFCIIGERLGERNRIVKGVSERRHAGQILHEILRRRPLRGLLSEIVLDDAIIAARAANGFPQLEVLLDGHLLVACNEDVPRLLEFLLEAFEILFFIRFLLHGYALKAASLRSRPRLCYACRALNAVTSRWMPGPIVEQSVTLLTYLPFAAAGFAFRT